MFKNLPAIRSLFRERALERVPLSSLASFWLLLLLSLAAVNGTSVQAQLTEHQMQAAVLANLAKFVDWPPSTPEEGPLRIGILGHDPFGRDLEKVLEGVKVKGRGFAVQRSQDLADLLDCHVIYFSAAETERVREGASLLKGRPILTAGEDDGFLDGGGIIRFDLKGNKVRFAINLESADQAGLSIHPQVLRLATEVRK